MPERPDDAVALVTGGSRGIGAAMRPRARRRRLARRAQLPLRRAGAPPRSSARSRTAGGRAVALRARRHRRRRRGDRCSPPPARRSAAACSALVNNAGIRDDGLAISLDDERWVARHRHQPHRRLPAHPRGAAADAPRALRADRQHRLGRRPARQPRPGQLRRREGRADRHDADRRRRGRAPRRHRQRGRPGLRRDRHDRGPAATRSLAGVPARRAGTPEEVAACVALPRLRRRRATSPARPCTSTAASPPDKEQHQMSSDTITTEHVQKVVYEALESFGAEPTQFTPRHDVREPRRRLARPRRAVADRRGRVRRRAQGRGHEEDQDRRRRRST